MSVTRYVLFARSSKGPPAYPGVAGIKGARIGVRFAFRVPDVIKQAAERGELTLEAVNDDALNFRKLGLGRVDYVLTNLDVGETLIRRLNLVDTRALLPAIEEFPTFVVFNKSLPTAPALRSAVDRGLLAARANHTEERIRSLYLR